MHSRDGTALFVNDGELRGTVCCTGSDRRACGDIAGDKVERVCAFCEGVVG